MDDKTLRNRRQDTISRLSEEVNHQRHRDDAERRRRLKRGADIKEIEHGLNPQRVAECINEIKKLRQTESLPSWVPQLSGSTYNMYAHPGVDGIKMGRMNADVLVGLPSLNQRNYTAAESKKIDKNILRFVKRPAEPDPTNNGEPLWKSHYSMYVSGFQLDVIKRVEEHSQNGAIPREWAELVGWTDPSVEPCPDKFWRTLVADRGRDGRNPPVYYARACRECFEKGGLRGGAVDTSGLINNERNSIVAQFCRRVQAVIWNRALAETESGSLALVGPEVKIGDKVCILYGCSVPVILRESVEPKSQAALQRELDLEISSVKDRLRRFIETNRERKRKLAQRKESDMRVFKKWEDDKMAEWLTDHDWRSNWLERQRKLCEGVRVERRMRHGPPIVVKTVPAQRRSTTANGTLANETNFGDLVPEDDDHSVDLRGYLNYASYAMYTRDIMTMESSGRRMQRALKSLKPEWETMKHNPTNAEEKERLWNGYREYVEVALVYIDLRRSQEFNAWKREMGKAAKTELEEWRRSRASHDQTLQQRPDEDEALNQSQGVPKTQGNTEDGFPQHDNLASAAVDGMLDEPESWGPGVIDWRKFDLRLRYFRQWRATIRRRKAQRLRDFRESERQKRQRTQQIVRTMLEEPTHPEIQASESSVMRSKSRSTHAVEALDLPVSTSNVNVSDGLRLRSTARSAAFGPSIDLDIEARCLQWFEPKLTYEEWSEALRHSLEKKRGEDAKHYFQFLGECYIHKMMDGEAMAFQNGANPWKKVIKPRVFELR